MRLAQKCMYNVYVLVNFNLVGAGLNFYTDKTFVALQELGEGNLKSIILHHSLVQCECQIFADCYCFVRLICDVIVHSFILR